LAVLDWISPWLMTVPPVYESAPLRAAIPEPVLTTASVPVSVPVAPSRMMPVNVEAALPMPIVSTAFAAPPLLTAPAPDSEARPMLKPLRLKVAPLATVNADDEPIAVAEPACKVPAEMVVVPV
jgi:hypothetical protein